MNVKILVAVVLVYHPVVTEAFFMLGGNNGCGCSAPPACPPPPPPPVCPSIPSCGCTHVVHAAPTAHVYSAPDDLELRAAAFGVPLRSDNLNNQAIQQLERLGESSVISESAVAVEKMEDADLFASLRRGSEIRRAPTVSVTKQEEVSTTTVATETNKVKGEELKPSNDKCNSDVLHQLMHEHMSDNSSESKRKINVAAEAKFGGNVDVVCSRGHFSYVFSSNLYCEATKGLTTCIAYRQAA